MKDFFPYPIKIDLMVYNLPFLTFCPPDILDEDNRPALEGRSIIYKRIDTKYKICFYNDSRYKNSKLINMDALILLHKHYENIKKVLINLIYFINKEKINLEGGNDIRKLFQLIYILYKSSNYFFFEKLINKKENIPSEYAILSRISDGVMYTLLEISLQQAADVKKMHFSPEDLYNFANNNNNLIGGQEVCAAPKKIIIDFFKFVYQYLYINIDKQTVNNEELTLNNKIENIYKFGEISYQMDMISLIYEVVRCKVWNVINNIADQKNQSLKNLQEPIKRFGFTHCSIAHRISKDVNPFENILFKRLENYYWVENYSNIIELIKYAHAVINELKIEKNFLEETTSLVEKILDFKKITIIFIEELVPFFEEKFNTGSSVFFKEIDIFFGKWPDIK